MTAIRRRSSVSSRSCGGRTGGSTSAYRVALSRLPPARQAALRASERAWIKARQAECGRLYREMEGGTADGLTLDTCMAVRAIERTAWLEHYR